MVDEHGIDLPVAVMEVDELDGEIVIMDENVEIVAVEIYEMYVSNGIVAGIVADVLGVVSVSKIVPGIVDLVR